MTKKRKEIIMGTCVDCVCYVFKKFGWGDTGHKCAHPENMAKEFDHITGKAKLASCYENNSDGECLHFKEKSKADEKWFQPVW